MFKVYGYYIARLERDRRRLLRRAVGPAVGDVELRAVHRAHDEHQRHRPLRRAGRLAPHRRALAARPELHAEHSGWRSGSTCRSPATCSTSSTGRRATTSSRASTSSTFGIAARLSSIRGASSSRSGCGSRLGRSVVPVSSVVRSDDRSTGRPSYRNNRSFAISPRVVASACDARPRCGRRCRAPSAAR